jgi:hypothetical protein
MRKLGEHEGPADADWDNGCDWSGLAWLVRAFIHIPFLPHLQNRLRVQHKSVWSYFTGQRSSPLTPELPGTAARQPTSATARFVRPSVQALARRESGKHD